MASLEEVQAYLDELLSVGDFAEEFPESNGLTVSVNEDVTNIGAAVFLTNDTIKKAISMGVDMLVTHHASWERIDFSMKFAKHLELEKNAINLYVAHESLDSHEELGPSTLLAKALDVQVAGRFAENYGVYGECKKSFEEMAQIVSGLPGANVSMRRNTGEAGDVAIVAGNGYKTEWMNEAFRLGCKTYVTGEGNIFTKTFARDAKMNLLLGGHYATERLSMELLVKIIEQELGLKAKLIEEDPI